MRESIFAAAILSLGLSACSDATVMVLNNQTACSFENVEGLKVRPNGSTDVVFAFERVDPRDERPVYFNLDWEGTLRITADQPVGYSDEFYVNPRYAEYDHPAANV